LNGCAFGQLGGASAPAVTHDQIEIDITDTTMGSTQRSPDYLTTILN